MSKFETKIADGKIRLNGILTDLSPAEAKELAEELAKAAKDAEVEFVAGGVYKDQDGVIYVGDAIPLGGGVRLWNAAKGTHCPPSWWQGKDGRRFTPVRKVNGTAVVVRT